MRALLLIPLLAACKANTLTLGDSGAAEDGSPADSGAPGDDSGGDDSPVDSTPPEPQPDLSQYSGTLTFSYESWGGCDGDTVTETATEVSVEDHPELRDACPACDHFYQITLDRGEVCEWVDVLEEDWRGLVLGDTWAQVYRFDETDDGFSETLLDNGAEFDGWTVEFETAFSYWGLDVQVEGVYTFPEL